MVLSVLIAVCNNDKPDQLSRALESIWHEQTHKPEQIVVVADGPLGYELDYMLGSWAEACQGHLEVVRLEQNQGLGAALNEGLAHCRNSLVARMDADDISLPERFQKQVSFMTENSHISLSSGLVEEFENEEDTSEMTRTLPTAHADIKRFAKKRNPISHPAAIFRFEHVKEIGGYPNFRKLQDWALVSLLLQNGYKLANLDEPLVRMRAGSGLQDRRGMKYLAYELKLFRFQKSIGFLTWRDFIFASSTRLALRTTPSPARKLLYKYAR